MKKYIYSVLILCFFCTAAKAQNNLQQTPKGTLYTIFTKNTGDKIKIDEVITLQVIQKTDKDSVLSSTYAAGRPGKLQVQDPASVQDPILSRVMEVLPLATLNDSLLVKIPADTLLKGQEQNRPPFFPKGSYLDLYIKIVNVQSLTDAIAERNAELAKIQADEITGANKYIADNKLVVKTTLSGLKYVITKTSLKPKPLAGDTVFVNYTGKLLNGQVFDSSIAAIAQQAGLQQPGRTYEPFKLVVGHGEVIKGWDEGLLLLNEGAKATFVIPSGLAYGEQGSPDGGKTIPPFSTLVFNIELVRVKRIKHTTAVKKPLAKKHYPATVKKK